MKLVNKATAFHQVYYLKASQRAWEMGITLLTIALHSSNQVAAVEGCSCNCCLRSSITGDIGSRRYASCSINLKVEPASSTTTLEQGYSLKTPLRARAVGETPVDIALCDSKR